MKLFGLAKRTPRPQTIRSASAISLVLMVSGMLAGTVLAGPVHAATTTTITIDGTPNAANKIFDGVGAVSAGASSRLLYDYPEPQRSQILDYLFKPGYGANLQILKLEIGGDMNSTDGAEPSAQHDSLATDANYARGYEFWLAQQALARNPNIQISALAWGLPGWVGDNDPNNPNPGHPYFWSQDSITYFVNWIKYAQSKGITIGTIGGWNERGFGYFTDATTQTKMKSWYENLHAALAAASLSTKIIASDDFMSWSVADAINADPTFAKSVDIVSNHYTCGRDEMTACPDSPSADQTGKTLWASESGGEDIDAGAVVARAINRGYIEAHTTAFMNWPPVVASYSNLQWAHTGLMLANQPWSGSYQLGSSLWAVAQTTQVSQPGWHYIDAASKDLGSGTTNPGSYVTLASPNGTDFSTVFETMNATSDQTVTVNITGGLSTGTLHVWSSDFTTGSYLTQQPDITPSSGSYTLTLKPGHIYSVTTLNTVGHGTATGNARATLALPYSASVKTGYVAGQEARYLSDMQGSFETTQCATGHTGLCLVQAATPTPLTWNVASEPFALLGDTSWTDYTVSSDVNFPSSTASAELIARAGQMASGQSNMNAYYVTLNSSGQWTIAKNSAAGGGHQTLASGTSATAPGTGAWHNLALTVQGSTLTASLDGAQLGTATDSSYPSGQVGIGTGDYEGVQFDNLKITPVDPSNYGQQWITIANSNSGKALEIPGSATGNGVGADQATSTGALGQQWALIADGSGYVKILNRGSGKLFEDPGFSASNGTVLDQWTDAGSDNELWTALQNSDGTVTLVNKSSGLVAGVSGSSLNDGTPVVQWTNLGIADQRWNLVPPAGHTYALFNRASGMTLEIPGLSTSQGTKADQWAYVSQTNEQWRAVDLGNGYFEFQNANSGLALDDTGASTAENNPLEQYAYISTAMNEQWQIVPDGLGYFQIKNRLSGLVLTVSNPLAGHGAAAVQATPAGTASEWSLVQVS